MLLLFNYTPEVSHATSCHGRSQGFHFLQHCPKRERFWHKCYCYLIIHLKYHMLHLVTDAVRVFIFCSIALRENGFDTILLFFNYTPEVSHATSCHGRSQGFHFLQHCPKRERFWHKCYCYLIIHLKYHMLHLVTDAVRVFIFCSIALRENGFDTSVTVI